MSDDFFEDDVVESKQDEPEKRAKKSTQKLTMSKIAAKKPTGAGTHSSFNLGTKLDLTWVVAIAVAAFTIGFVAHATFFSTPVTQSAGTYNAAPASGSGTAPPLSDEQIQKYQSQGNLPAGHPQIDGSGAATDTGSGQTKQAPESNGSTGK